MPSDYVFDFFIQTADVNHDRYVDLVDFSALSMHFNQAGTFTQGDFNYDGKVNALDFNALASLWGTYLAPPTPSEPILLSESASVPRALATPLTLPTLFSDEKIIDSAAAGLLQTL